MLADLIIPIIGGLIFAVYWYFRLGPRRCPDCDKLVFGYWEVPIGVRRLRFHCPSCGLWFEGQKRMPM